MPKSQQRRHVKPSDARFDFLNRKNQIAPKDMPAERAEKEKLIAEWKKRNAK